MDRPTEYSATILLKALLLPGFYEALRGVNPDDFGDYYALRDQLEEQQFDFIGQAAPGIEAALNRYLDRQLAAPMIPAVRGEDYDPRALAAIFLDPASSEDELRDAGLYGAQHGNEIEITQDIIGTAPNLLAEYCHLLGGGDRAEALALLAVLVGDYDGWQQALAGEDLDTLQRDLKAQAEGERVRYFVTVRMPEGRWNDWSKTATLDVEVSTVVAEGETVAEAIRSCQLGAPLLEFESPEPWSGPAPRRSQAPVRGDLNPYGHPKMSVDDRGARGPEAQRALSAINEGMTLLRGWTRSRKGADDTEGQWNAVVRAIRGSEATAAAYFYDYAPKGIPAYADRRAWTRWNDANLSLPDDAPSIPFTGRLYYGEMPETAPAPEPPVREVAPGVTAYEFSRMQDDDEKRQAAASLVSQLSPRRAPVAEPEPAPRKLSIQDDRNRGKMLAKLFPPIEVVFESVPPALAFDGSIIRPGFSGWKLAGTTGSTLAATREEVEQRAADRREVEMTEENRRLLHLSDDGFKAERERLLGFNEVVSDYLDTMLASDRDRVLAELSKPEMLKEGRKKTDKTFQGTRAEVADQMLKAGYFTIIQQPPGGSKEVPLLKNWQGVFEVKPAVFAFAEWLQERRKRDERALELDGARESARWVAQQERQANPRRRSNPDIGTSMIYGYGINQMTPSAPMGGRTANGAASAVRQARLAAEAERLAQRLARGRR